MRRQIWRHEWACRVKDAQKLSGKTMCSCEISIASHASFRIIWSVFGLWWNWNHCMRMSLPALLAEICSPEIAVCLGLFWIKWLNWWFSITETFRWTFTNPALPALPAWSLVSFSFDCFKRGGRPLCPLEQLCETNDLRPGHHLRVEDLMVSPGMLSSEGVCGDCWWFLVDASQIWSHRQLPTKQRSWCPVWVQVSLMLLVVEELVGCASPFLDRDSTLICSCFKSTQHSTDQKIAVLCCSFQSTLWNLHFAWICLIWQMVSFLCWAILWDPASNPSSTIPSLLDLLQSTF